MINRIIVAVVIGCVVGLVLVLLGLILSTIGIPLAEAVGGFLTAWAWAIGVLAGLYVFATGRTAVL